MNYLPGLQKLISKHGSKIIHQNIRGLLCHKHFVSELLDNFQTIYLVAPSEPYTASDDNPHLQIPGYKFETRHRETGQEGGVSFNLLKNVPYQRRYDLERNDMESIWYAIISPKTTVFHVGVVRRSPNSSNHVTENCKEKWNKMLETVMAENIAFILMNGMKCNYLER